MSERESCLGGGKILFCTPPCQDFFHRFGRWLCDGETGCRDGGFLRLTLSSGQTRPVATQRAAIQPPLSRETNSDADKTPPPLTPLSSSPQERLFIHPPSTPVIRGVHGKGVILAFEKDPPPVFLTELCRVHVRDKGMLERWGGMPFPLSP
jgi:hypothetical protein